MSRLFNKIQELEEICKQSLNEGCNKKTLSKCDNKELGSGNFGIVKKCFNTNNNDYAVKMVKNLSVLSKENKENEKIKLLNEAIIMINIGDHDNIVKIMGINIIPLDFDNIDYDVSFLLEICNLGSLNTYLSNLKQKNKKINKQILHKIVFQITNGMLYLSDKNVIHNDLSAKNILLCNDLTAKISDFGLSKVLYGNDRKLGYTIDKNIGGAFLWLSPESLYQNMYSEKSDVWSFGIVLYEIELNGALPLYKNLDGSYFKVDKYSKDVFVKMLIIDDVRHKSNNILPKYLDDIMHSCWNLNYHLRPSFKEIMDKLKFHNTISNKKANSVKKKKKKSSKKKKK